MMKRAPYFRLIGWLLCLFALLGLAGSATALSSSQQTDVWTARYWNNTTLAGSPDLTRTESTVNHNWGLNSPDPVIEADRFSARWEGSLDLAAGEYQFTVTADDGVRVWINGRLLIDEWQVQPATTYTAQLVTNGNNVPVVIEYFENTGVAQISFSWQRLNGFEDRWQAEYFNNIALDGSPALIRAEQAIDYEWGTTSPAPDIINPDTFSARWTRDITVQPGQYQFTVTVDDGARLWVNNRLLIDAWDVQVETTYQREVALSGGETPIRLEYFENGGLATAQLSWSRLHELPQPSPSTLIDNGGSGFVAGGPNSDWHTEFEGYNGSLLWSTSTEQVGPNYNWARWYPTLTPGFYEVQVYVPFRFSTTTQARYWISHADGYELRIVDQSATGGDWVSLGTYEFEGGGSDFVSLADVTFEDESRLVAYDAVRWLRVSD